MKEEKFAYNLLPIWTVEVIMADKEATSKKKERWNSFKCQNSVKVTQHYTISLSL